MKIYLFVAVLTVLAISTQPTHAQSSFTLKEGWNLISNDVIENLYHDRSAIDKLFQDGGALYALNREDKKYYGSDESLSDAEADLERMYQDISDGDDGVFAMGWWLYSPKETFRLVDFEIPSDLRRNYQEAYHLRKGWNLTGITAIMLNKSLVSLKGTCNFLSVYNFQSEAWRKQSDIDMGEKFTNDSLGHALAIRVEDDCVFNFKGGSSIPNLPALPE